MLVWGTPANFNGFRVLAALLHSTLVLVSAKLCSVEEGVPPIFSRAAIMLGIGPHSSYIYIVLQKLEDAVKLIVLPRVKFEKWLTFYSYHQESSFLWFSVPLPGHVRISLDVNKRSE